ncbi:MAG: ABC transporter permease [Chloroflexi bacterium]|nr:ABC transporter permease [Chloroflexota bacterium]
MASYTIRRLLEILVNLLLVSLLSFWIMWQTPGGPFDETNQPLSKEAKANIRAKYGLDKPFYVIWWNYVKNAVQGDFGISYQFPTQSITTLFQRYWVNSLILGGLSVLWSFPVGAIVGVIAALKRNSWIDRTITTVSLVGVTMPQIALIFVAILIFSVQLKWLPWGSGRDLLQQKWQFLVMPVFLFGFPTVGSLARYVRSGMLDVMGQEYIRTARAKGLVYSKVVMKHAMRNMMIPIVTLFGPTLANAFTGSALIEIAFVIPGIGKFFLDSVFSRDYPLLMAVTLVGSAILSVTYLLSDLSYSLIDPRVRAGGGRK